MKLIREKQVKGKTRVTVELSPGGKLIEVCEDGHYKLAYPVEDIVGGHVVLGCRQVTWCSASQEWVD